jgi:hypothetical protein
MVVFYGLFPRSSLCSRRRSSRRRLLYFILPFTLGVFFSVQLTAFSQSSPLPPPNMSPSEALDYLFGDPNDFLTDFHFTLTEFLNPYFGIALSVFCFSLVLSKL